MDSLFDSDTHSAFENEDHFILNNDKYLLTFVQSARLMDTQSNRQIW